MDSQTTDRRDAEPATAPDSTSATAPVPGIPVDIERAKAKARSLARTGRFDEALDCWRHIEELDPYDPEPSHMISALTLSRTRRTDSANIDDACAPDSCQADPPPAPTPSDVSRQAPPGPRQISLTRRQQLELDISQRPEDETNYLALAELHLAEQRTYEAQRTLMRASAVCKSTAVTERLEDVNMLLARERVKRAEERAAVGGEPDLQDEVQRLRNELSQLELDIYRNRCVRSPDDKRLKFQLGLALKQSGSHRDSLELLQAGLEFPDLRAQASLEIGEVLQRHNLLPKALQCYRQSAQLAAGDPRAEECRRRALYRAGVLATAMTLTDTARGYLTELVKIAPNYRDAQTRLDKLEEISETSRSDFREPSAF